MEQVQLLDATVRQLHPADRLFNGVVAFRRQFQQFAL